MNWKSDREAALKAARDLVDGAKAAGRNLTADERAEVEAKIKEADDLEARIKRADEDAALRARIEASGSHLVDHSTLAKSVGNTYVKGALQAMGTAAGALGVKALLTGEVSTPSVVEVAALPSTPTVLLDLLPRQTLTEHTFGYLRQVLRDEHADAVEDGALKPTSVYAFQEVQDHARVIAHLSEPFPLRYMGDHESMLQVLSTEMVAGVERALEREVLAGDGTGAHFTGLLKTEGVREVTYAGDMVTTMRRAITASQRLGITPTAWVLAAEDAEALDLTREGAEGGFLLGGDVRDRMGSAGLKFVVSTNLTPGKAILADWTAARLMVREGTSVLSATQGGDLFDHNLVKLRAEGQFGFAVHRPEAFALVDVRPAAQ